MPLFEKKIKVEDSIESFKTSSIEVLAEFIKGSRWGRPDLFEIRKGLAAQCIEDLKKPTQCLAKQNVIERLEKLQQDNITRTADYQEANMKAIYGENYNPEMYSKPPEIGPGTLNKLIDKHLEKLRTFENLNARELKEIPTPRKDSM